MGKHSASTAQQEVQKAGNGRGIGLHVWQSYRDSPYWVRHPARNTLSGNQAKVFYHKSLTKDLEVSISGCFCRHVSATIFVS